MALEQGKGAITSQDGNTSQVLIAEQLDYSDITQTDASTPLVVAANGATSGGDFYSEQPRITGADIARIGTTIAQTEFDGSASQTKDAAGPYNVENSIDFSISGNGTALLLRNVTQTRNPEWDILGGTGQTLPATVNVVANTELLKGTSTDATITDNLSSTTNPVQIVVTPSATATIDGQTASVYIKGTDHMDREIDYTLVFTSSTATTAATTPLYYKTVTQISSEGWQEASGKTYGVTARDVATLVKFIPQDESLDCYWTIEVAKGLVPNVYWGCIANETTIEISREELLVANCSILGRDSRVYTNLAGDTGPTARKTDDSGLKRAQGSVFAGWQCVMTAEDTDIEVAMQEATLTINQNLEYTNVLGTQSQPSPPARSTKRLVELEATIVYAPENNFSEYFENNTNLPNVKLTFQQVALGAFPYKLTFIIPQAQLTSDPDPAVTDEGTIQQTVNIKAIRTSTTAAEYSIEAEYSSYDRVRIYS